jgi:cyanophycin synthetase
MTKLKVTSRIIKAELEKRGIKVEIVTETPRGVLRYYHNSRWHLLFSTLPESSAGVGHVICDHKDLSNTVAVMHGIPVPETTEYNDMESAIDFMHCHNSVVVKPADAAHGNGVTVGVQDEKALQRAVKAAQENSSGDGILLQQMVSGGDLRMLVIGGKYVATARRIPAEVTGDGSHTLRQLIEHENAHNPNRGVNYEKRLCVIDVDAAERYLGDRIDREVPATGQIVSVVGTANIGTGGYAVDYTEKVTTGLIAAAERFARAVKVVACGVDFMWDEATGEYYFIEGNSIPSFTLHTNPSVGTPRAVEKPFVDFLLANSKREWHVTDQVNGPDEV